MKKLNLLWLLWALAMTSFAQARLPKVVLKSIEGRSVQTDTLQNGGRPMVVAFFATWCKPCNRELKAIDEVYAHWQKETGVRLVAVSIDQAQNANKVKPLVDENGWTYDVRLPTQWLYRRSRDRTVRESEGSLWAINGCDRGFGQLWPCVLSARRWLQKSPREGIRSG